MIKEFNVLLVGDFLSEKEIDLALNAFEEFYSSVTFKHQKKIKLTIVEAKENFPLLTQMLKKRDLNDVCELVEPENEQAVNNVLRQVSIMFLPTDSNISKLIPLAFEYSLPIIGVETNLTKELLDHTCSMTIEVSTDSEMQEGFSTILRMLYFDPEASKILSRGSLAKYNMDYNWGRGRLATA